MYVLCCICVFFVCINKDKVENIGNIEVIPFVLSFLSGFFKAKAGLFMCVHD